MRRVGSNTFVEIYYPGCNPGFVETSDGVVMIDTPQQPINAVCWRERIQSAGPIRYLINTEPHGDHTLGNRFFHGVTVVGHRSISSIFERYAERMRVNLQANAPKDDPDSVWLWEHPDYQNVNRPTVLFDDELTLHAGNHTFRCIHMPGHTAPQTSVYIPEEGVVFTGDNIFYRCRSWLQEADPWAWLNALEAIERLDVETIVPGHGETCTKAYLKDQAEIIHRWLGEIGRLVDKGAEEDEVRAAGSVLIDQIDPYPMGQRLDDWKPRVGPLNAVNLYRAILERRMQDARPDGRTQSRS
ncbi:MAG: MBL fold metallo-hydrolase [Xanthobacteraceae bacterium]